MRKKINNNYLKITSILIYIIILNQMLALNVYTQVVISILYSLYICTLMYLYK